RSGGESLPQSKRVVVGLCVGLVANARPEEAAQTILATPRHDMHVEVRDALTDDVVDGNERPVAVECGGHASRDSLHSFEEWSDKIGIEVDKSHTVPKRCDKDVSLENG
ncbi:MAG: hypothetical protein QOH53_1706, partial [Ilumatobacteraceae bacterium]